MYEPKHLQRWEMPRHYAGATWDNIRREMLATGQPYSDLVETVAAGNQIWTTDQLREEFEVLGFCAPFVVARRRSDGKEGSLEFTHSPRVYFNWKEN